MSMHDVSGRAAAQGVPVIRATDFSVSNGANLGDPMGHSAEVILDDIYNLAPAAQRWRLNMDAVDGQSHFTVSDLSQLGRPGAALHLDCCATFMAPDGAIVEALVMVELEPGEALVAATPTCCRWPICGRASTTLWSASTRGPRGASWRTWPACRSPGAPGSPWPTAPSARSSSWRPATWC